MFWALKQHIFLNTTGKLNFKPSNTLGQYNQNKGKSPWDITLIEFIKSTAKMEYQKVSTYMLPLYEEYLIWINNQDCDTMFSTLLVLWIQVVRNEITQCS